MDRSTDTIAHNRSDRIARAAWLCAFVLPLALAALLLGVKSAQAATPPPMTMPLAFEEELEVEDEAGEEGEEDEAQSEAEFAEEECETAEEEATEGEIDQAEVEEICKEAAELADPSSHSSPAPTGHRRHPHRHKHRHKKACGHGKAGHKRPCPHRSRHR